MLTKICMLILVPANVVLLTACGNNADSNWVSTTGKVKDIQGINPEGTEATETKKPLYMTVTFQYEFNDKSYEGSQTVSINTPVRFEAGKSVDVKINKQNPYIAKIDLPPEPPDRTGMRWRRMPVSVKSTSCP